MGYLRHGVAALVVFSILVSLFVAVYDGFEDEYALTEEYTFNSSFSYEENVNGTQTSVQVDTEGNIMEQFKQLNVVEGVAEINAEVSKLGGGGASTFDILGSLASTALGILKATFGLFTAPYGVTYIILNYYFGNGIAIAGGIIMLVTVYIAFILLSAYLGRKV